MSTTFLSKFTYCYYFLRLWQHTNNHYVSKMIYDSIYTYPFVMYAMCQETLLNLYVKFINQHMVDRVNSTQEKRWIFSGQKPFVQTNYCRCMACAIFYGTHEVGLFWGQYLASSYSGLQELSHLRRIPPQSPCNFSRCMVLYSTIWY